MSITISTIIHPYFTGDNIRKNQIIYNKIIKETLREPNRYLIYEAGSYNPIEMELQNELHNASEQSSNQFATLPGDEDLGIYRDDRLSTLDSQLTIENKSLIHRFLTHGFTTIYNREITKAYTNITTIDSRLLYPLQDQYQEKLSGNLFLVTNIHSQIAQIVRRIGTVPTNIKLGENNSALTIRQDVLRDTKIVGSGEWLEGCVLIESTGLAITLGVPLQNISLNSTQPYLRDYREKDALFYSHPIEYICNNFVSPIEGNLSSEGKY